MLSSMSLWHSTVRAALGVFVVAAVSSRAAPARADESGWFDAQPAPAGTASAPAPTPAPAPAEGPAPGSELPSLPPSPLLEPQAQTPAEPVEVDAGDRDPRALSDFRPALDPYGYWMQHPTYGTVWVPNRAVVGAGFAPYVTSGRWALDDHGEWIWVSDYPFGHVVFHYGRWVWVAGTGWAWIPGYRYAPAWVVWRVPVAGSAYIGWAPMGPDFIWYNGVAVSFWYGSPTPWVFCPSVHVFHRHVHHYIIRDRVVIHRAAAETRRYTPAVPRTQARPARMHYPSSPSLAAARVPAHAVPRERVRREPVVRESVPRLSARPGVGRTVAPSAGSRLRTEPPRTREAAPLRSPGAARPEPAPRLAPAPRVPPDRRLAPRQSEPAPRVQPERSAEPRRVEPRRVEPQPRVAPERRRMEPREIEPRRVEPRRIEPQRRIEPPRRSAPMRQLAPGAPLRQRRH